MKKPTEIAVDETSSVGLWACSDEHGVLLSVVVLWPDLLVEAYSQSDDSQHATSDRHASDDRPALIAVPEHLSCVCLSCPDDDHGHVDTNAWKQSLGLAGPPAAREDQTFLVATSLAGKNSVHPHGCTDQDHGQAAQGGTVVLVMNDEAVCQEDREDEEQNTDGPVRQSCPLGFDTTLLFHDVLQLLKRVNFWTTAFYIILIR